MLTKEQVIQLARDIGFADVGFTSTEEFSSQRKILEERAANYAWAAERGLNLNEGSEPLSIYPDAKSVIVLLENYHRQAFPVSLLGKFGRCYLDDDRVTKDGLAVKVKKFRAELREAGIQTKAANQVPHRLAAARAGLGTFGKNNLLYANRAAWKSSLVLPIVVLADHEFLPDEPTVKIGCPDWCRNVCIVACPTRALTGPGKIDPQRCISYLTYYGEGITPREFREPMGTWIYGCDRCQNVCPRNEACLNRELPINPRITAKEKDFQMSVLLSMDDDFFRSQVWPHMFYMPKRDVWRWKMNVARAIGNSGETEYIPALIQAFDDNQDERVRGMAAWSLGKLGGEEAKQALNRWLDQAEGLVAEEIRLALGD